MFLTPYVLLPDIPEESVVVVTEKPTDNILKMRNGVVTKFPQQCRKLSDGRA